MKQVPVLSALIAASFLAAPAAAQPAGEQRAFVRVGVTHIDLADNGSIFINGTRDPGAGYKTDKDWVANAEIGYFVHPLVAVRLAGTSPAKTYNLPAGSLAGTPNLGNDTSSNFTLTATVHPIRGRGISPYVGGGIGLNKIWSTQDRLATNLKIHDAHGPVIQAGVEFDLGDRFGIYFDAKKAFWSAEASGSLGPAKVTAEAELDPVLLSGGALLRF
jgi:outer membrane protein W